MARTKNTPHVTESEALFAAFQAFIAENAPAKKAPATKTRTKKAPVGCLTAQHLWEALGSDPKYAPKNPARNTFLGKQLDLLNSQGRLRIVA
jgi:hypothetical protein